MMALDIIIIPLSYWLSINLRTDFQHLVLSPAEFGLVFAVLFISSPFYIKLGLYRAVVRFVGMQAAIAILKASLISTVLFIVLQHALNVTIPPSTSIIFLIVSCVLLAGSRFSVRQWLSQIGISGKQPLVIYGGGSAGTQLLMALFSTNNFRPVAFIDDDVTLQGMSIHGMHVYSFEDLDKILRQFAAKHIAIAMPSATASEKKIIIEKLEPFAVHVLTIPSTEELIGGIRSIEQIRDIEIDELLGRAPVEPIPSLMKSSITNKKVMVTGSGGSIGSELCRQIIDLAPAALVLFEQSEHSLYQLNRELISKLPENSDTEIIPLLGNVTNRESIRLAISTHQVDTIFHAAAYKHVPIVEDNISEGVRNNIFGTLYTAMAAVESKVTTFVLISTDKAVRPTNIMGATKRVSELILQALAGKFGATVFCMVRFGNVLGSSGSVVPLFREQIREGGPVTVTHPEIIRYFMTIPEASQLVLQASALAKGGDVFVLDMGEPVKILDLAKRMIQLSGCSLRLESSPCDGISIEFSGLRPGEKLYEELLIGDKVIGTSHPRIMRAMEKSISWDEISLLLNSLESAIKVGDNVEIKSILLHSQTDYKPANCVGKEAKRHKKDITLKVKSVQGL